MRLRSPPNVPMARSARNANVADAHDSFRQYGAAAPETGEGASQPRLRLRPTPLNALRITWPMCGQKAASNARTSPVWSATISLSAYGWQRIAPCPKTISVRVRMLAPSTVMDTGAPM